MKIFIAHRRTVWSPVRFRLVDLVNMNHTTGERTEYYQREQNCLPRMVSDEVSQSEKTESTNMYTDIFICMLTS